MNRDLDQLVQDLSGAGQWTHQRAAEVVERAGERLRDDARRLAPRTQLPKYAEAITSEVDRGAGAVTAEVGPEKGRGHQGSLGAILEFGTSRTPPHAHMGPALDLEGPRFEKDLVELLDPFGNRR